MVYCIPKEEEEGSTRKKTKMTPFKKSIAIDEITNRTHKYA